MPLAEKAYMNEAADEEARNALVLGELDQVYYIAQRIRERLPHQVELEDLVNAGVIGLLEASRTFDSSKNTHFRSYAKFRIRGAIMDSLRESDWGSRSLRRRAREIADATATLAARLRRQPVEAEIAAEMGWTTKKFQSVAAQIDGLFVAGQQAAISGDGDHFVDLVESAPSLDDPDPFDLCLEGERSQHLAEAISKLSEREQLILSLYYREELTMKEIAQIVGVALSRVSQIRQAALIKLREFLGHLEERQYTDSVPYAKCDEHA